jgi:hypothetical protein
MFSSVNGNKNAPGEDTGALLVSKTLLPSGLSPSAPESRRVSSFELAGFTAGRVFHPVPKTIFFLMIAKMRLARQ